MRQLLSLLAAVIAIAVSGQALALVPVGPDIRLDPDTKYTMQSSIAYGDGVYAIAYIEASQAGQYPTQVWVAFINPSTGAVLGQYQISAPVGAGRSYVRVASVSIAYNPVDTEFGVAWWGQQDATETDTWFRPVNKNGSSRLSEVQIVSYPGMNDNLALEWDSVIGKYAMARAEYYPSQWQIRLLTFDKDGGNRVESGPFGGPDAFYIALAVGLDGYGVACARQESGTYHTYFMYLNRSLNLVTSPVLLGGGSSINTDTSIAYGDGGFGIVWNIRPPSPSIMFVHVNTAAQGTPMTLVSNDCDLQDPDIIWDGTKFVTVWGDARDCGLPQPWKFYGMTHDKYGASETGDALLLDGPAQYSGIAASAPNYYCTTYVIGNTEVHLRRGYEDTIPPGPVTGFTATAGEAQITLSWTNPSDTDFTATMIRYKTTGYPTGPTDGTLLVDKTNTPGSSDSYMHTGLTYGLTYYYAAFAHDQYNNYATAATAQASPMDTTPPGPVNSFTATPSNGRVTLAWVNPSDADFTATRIRYKTTGFPTGPTNGILLVDKANTPGSSDTYVHNGLTNGVTYSYAAFAHDSVPNYAAAAHASGKPFLPGDLDLDGDVDQQDFGHLQACLSGSGTPYAAGCADADLEGDNDVDTNDLGVFLDCMAGADQPPGC